VPCSSRGLCRDGGITPEESGRRARQPSHCLRLRPGWDQGAARLSKAVSNDPRLHASSPARVDANVVSGPTANVMKARHHDQGYGPKIQAIAHASWLSQPGRQVQLLDAPLDASTKPCRCTSCDPEEPQPESCSRREPDRRVECPAQHARGRPVARNGQRRST